MGRQRVGVCFSFEPGSHAPLLNLWLAVGLQENILAIKCCRLNYLGKSSFRAEDHPKKPMVHV